MILVDTKFEFGFIDGRLTLIDEVLTPDSSRFWEASQWQRGAFDALIRQAAGAGLAGQPALGQDSARSCAARRHRGATSARYAEAARRDLRT